MMNNMVIGHEFLEREFGDYARPRIGWHIDPFGHSNANPRLFAEMGFDAWFFARIDFEVGCLLFVGIGVGVCVGRQCVMISTCRGVGLDGVLAG